MKSIKRMILMGVAIMALMSFAVPAMAQVKGSPGTTYSGTDARAWGNNSLDELGDGTTTQRNTSVAVKIMNGVSVISGGGSQSLAIKTDGTVFAWGSSWAGQLGDGTTTNRTAPVQVSELS